MDYFTTRSAYLAILFLSASPYKTEAWGGESMSPNSWYIRNNIPGTNCTIAGDWPCTCIKPAPPGEELELELTDLLNRGSDFLKNYTSLENAVLLLGNTGAGKTTATQIIAGNLERLYSVSDAGENLVIVDEDNKIGLPSLKSKTLFPELVVKNDTIPPLSFYDFPGFDDTRGSVQDIAANFFMTEVIKKVANIKMLFLTTQAAMNIDNRVELDKLFQYVVKFVKNISDYKNSFALIVNKVHSYSGFGSYIPDEVIINGIVTSLQTYNMFLYNSLKNGSEEANLVTLKKISLVNILLEQEQNETYQRIWIIRSPLACGRLSEQQNMIDTRNNIAKVYERLEFTAVGNGDENFGYTLKQSTIIDIASYSKTFNKEISDATRDVISISSFWYLNQIKTRSLQLREPLMAMQKVRLGFEKFNEWIANQTDTTDSIAFALQMKDFHSSLGYPLSHKYQTFLERVETYLLFFDKASNERQTRSIGDWSSKVFEFYDEFRVLYDWYEFCSKLEDVTSSALFHQNAPQSPSKANCSYLVDYIEMHDIVYVSTHIKDISCKLDQFYIDMLANLLLFATRPVRIYCDSSSTNAAIIEGNFLLLNKLTTGNHSAIKFCNGAKEIVFLAGHTAFLTDKVTLQNTSVTLLSPLLTAFSSNDLGIYLDGIDGVAHDPATVGGAGASGYRGKAGVSAGSAALIINKVQATSNIRINTNGGNGGPGQHGGSGRRGESATDAVCIRQGGTVCNTYGFDTPDNCYYVTSDGAHRDIVKCEHYGNSGEDGSNGGNGGAGGLGGYAGENKVIYFEAVSPNSTYFVQEHRNGTHGTKGNGGQGGEGGRAGKGYKNYASEDCSQEEPSRGRSDGKPGTNGIAGESEICPGDPCPEVPSKAIPNRELWKSVLQYRTRFFDIMYPTTVEFLNLIDTSTESSSIFTLKALAEEYLALEGAIVGRNETKRLNDMYFSLVERLETFYANNLAKIPLEHQKILTMLLSSTFAYLQAQESKNDLHLNVDIKSYLSQSGENIKRVIPIEDRNEMNSTLHQDCETFIRGLHQTMNESIGFLEVIFIPEIHAAKNETLQKLSELGMLIEELINDPAASLEQKKYKLQEAERQKQIYKRAYLLDFVLSLASGLVPYENLIENFTESLKERFADEAIKLIELEEMLEDLDKMIDEVIEQSKNYKRSFGSVINNTLDYFTEVAENITTGGVISNPEYPLSNRYLVTSLIECKHAIQEFKDMSLYEKPISLAMSRAQDALTFSIEILYRIDLHQGKQSLARYIALMQSSALAPIQIRDPELKDSVANFDITLKLNILSAEFEKSYRAFKQWVFPFAKFYVFNQTDMPVGKLVGDEELIKLEYLQQEVEKYKKGLIGDQEMLVIKSNFSSDCTDNQRSPFFVWENENYKNKIQSLLSGELINLDADIMLYKMEGTEAVKFNLIEINLKLHSVPGEIQDKFDCLIQYFGVSMTHSGISNYRFNLDYFVMASVNQTLVYNFEKDSSGNRKGTNVVYEKFKRGDYLLSPYTVWSVQLILSGNDQDPSVCNVTSNAISFADLGEFSHFVDIELVGTGTYVDAERSIAAAGGDLELDTYYHRDNVFKSFF